MEAVEEMGAWKGTLLALRRLAKCHPWHPGGFDPVPSVPAGKAVRGRRDVKPLKR